MRRHPPSISLSRLGKVATFAGGGFAVGFLLMSIVNGIAYGLAGAAGAHPTGAGNAASQLVAGIFLAVIAAVFTTVLTSEGDANAHGPRISIRTVAVGLALVIGGPLVAHELHRQSVESAEMRALEAAVRGRGVAAFDEADSLWRFSRGPRILSGILHDAAATPDARLTAGLMLIESKAGTAEDEPEVERLIRRGSPQRATFVNLYATDRSIYSNETIDRWIRQTLQDPEPAMRVAAVRALLGHPKDMELCEPLNELARDPDAAIRAEAILLVSACTSDSRRLLQAGLRDIDPRVRLAVVKRLGWRFTGTTDSPDYLTTAEELLSDLLRDSNPEVRQAAALQLDTIRPRATPR